MTITLELSDAQRATSLAAKLAACTAARRTSVAARDATGVAGWTRRIVQLRELLPTGDGLAAAQTVSVTEARIMLLCEFHHYTDDGASVTRHKITARPAWCGIAVAVQGPDRNGCRAVIAERYTAALSRFVAWNESTGGYEVQS